MSNLCFVSPVEAAHWTERYLEGGKKKSLPPPFFLSTWKILYCIVNFELLYCT